MKPNYIELINGFWAYYDANKPKISPSDITLYMVLLRYCNKINWINPFTINPFLMAEINPLSQNTYYKSLKNLNDCGIIKWEKGKHNVSNLKITILKIKVSVNNSIDNSIKFSLEDSIDNSIVNNNKTTYTIKQLNNKTEKEIFANFINSFNLVTGKKFRVAIDKFKKQFEQRLKEGFTIEEILKAAENCSKDLYHVQNPQHLTPEFITRPDKLEKYLNVPKQPINVTNQALNGFNNQTGEGGMVDGIFVEFSKMSTRERDIYRANQRNEKFLNGIYGNPQQQ